MTEKQFTYGFSVLMANFGKDYPAATLKMFYKLVKDLNPESFLKAVQSICQEQKELYPGTNLIALIRHKAVEMELSLPSPEEAWEMVVTAFDCQASNLVNQPIVKRAANAIGGLDSIRFRYRVDLDSDPGIVRSQFIKQYTALAAREHSEHVSPVSRIEAGSVLKQVGYEGKE